MYGLYCTFPPATTHIRYQHEDIILDSRKSSGITKMLLNPGLEVEPHESLAFSRLVPYAKTIFDIGANIGIYSVLAAKINASARIYGFEPNPVNLKKLNHNIALNQAANVTIVDKAVGAEKGMIEFVVPENEEASAVSSTNEAFTKMWHKSVKKIQVDQISLDDFVEANNIGSVDLVKLDVEGYEQFVLRGAKKMFSVMSPAVIMEIHLPQVLADEYKNDALNLDENAPLEIQSFFTDRGYTIYAIGERGLLKISNVFSHPDSRNYLFSKYEAASYYIPYDAPEYKNLI